MKRTLIAIGLIATFAGCGTIHQEHFQQFTTRAEVASREHLSRQKPPRAKDIVLREGSDLERDIQALKETWHALLGFSSFVDDEINRDDARQFGRKIGAEVILLHARHLGTSEGSFPLVLPGSPQTSTTTSQAYGTYGRTPFNVQGSSQTTSPGPPVTMNIPFSRSHYHIQVGYWVKLIPQKLSFGASFEPLSDDLRRKLSRNTGLRVTTVFPGSPAFNSNIMVGDIILEVAGEELTGVAPTQELFARKQGTAVTVKFLRNGVEQEKSVKLNPK